MSFGLALYNLISNIKPNIFIIIKQRFWDSNNLAFFIFRNNNSPWHVIYTLFVSFGPFWAIDYWNPANISLWSITYIVLAEITDLVREEFFREVVLFLSSELAGISP